MRVSSPLPEFAVAPQHVGSMSAPGMNVGPRRMNGAADPDAIPWSRYIDAIKRHSLFILALAITGSVLGARVAIHTVKPVYDAQASVWINSRLP